MIRGRPNYGSMALVFAVVALTLGMCWQLILYEQRIDVLESNILGYKFESEKLKNMLAQCREEKSLLRRGEID